jgi:hypothetical protein
VDDLRATNPPSNPALLDALANEYRRVKFDPKALIRTIMTSHVYGLSSVPNETNVADTRNYSRHYRTQLRAETLLDAITDLTGTAENFSGMPVGSRAVEMWTYRTDSTFLDVFGRPDANLDPPCERAVDATMVQALHLMNADNLQRKIHADDGLAARLAASERPPAEVVTELYLTVYSRPPTAEELQAGTALFSDDALRRQTTEDLMWAMVNSPEFVVKN